MKEKIGFDCKYGTIKSKINIIENRLIFLYIWVKVTKENVRIFLIKPPILYNYKDK